MARKNLTIVTGLFDIGRDKLEEGFARPFEHYVEHFEHFLKATKDYPLVVFIEEKNESIVWKHRSRENTAVVIKDLDYLRNFPFYDQVQKIRNNKEWKTRSGWIVDSPQSALDLYNPLVMSKQFMLNDATHFNFFNTKYYLWMDAGLTNTVSLAGYIDKTFEQRITPFMKKMLYLCFPYDGKVEVHGFEKTKLNEYAGAETTWVARGGVFGGTKDSINRMNEIYYSLLNDTINSGYMGTEESLYTIITYRHPELCNLHMIESNGLVYKFFEDIKAINNTNPDAAEMALYVLVYNLPEQFKLWVESFIAAYGDDFNRFKKYAINNSNDKKVTKEFNKLFKEYGFEEHKFNNVGICGGRQFAAEHFAKSDHKYMIFFEDDMLLHNDPKIRCKSGFTSYHDDLFDKCMEIIDNENLDYLKLSFSEFYGDNSDNWAWYNVPKNVKNQYFDPLEESSKKTKLKYCNIHRGLPYAVGDFYYCNWPIVFTKRGNQKVFLDVTWEHKYEQTWMSYVHMDLISTDEIKVGCLLASPINHNRVFHYKAGTRRENEKYTN